MKRAAVRDEQRPFFIPTLGEAALKLTHPDRRCERLWGFRSKAPPVVLRRGFRCTQRASLRRV